MFFARATQDYTRQDEGELSVKTGDFLVIEKTFGNPGFWLSVLNIKDKGWVPSKHIKQIDPDALWSDQPAGEDEEDEKESKEFEVAAVGLDSQSKTLVSIPSDQVEAFRDRQRAAARKQEEETKDTFVRDQAFRASAFDRHGASVSEIASQIYRGTRQVEGRLLQAEHVRSYPPPPQLVSQKLLSEQERQMQAKLPLHEQDDYVEPTLTEKQFVYTADGGLSKEVNRQHIVYAGYMNYKKATAKESKAWKKRFVVLYRNQIEQYLKPKDNKDKYSFSTDNMPLPEYKKHANSNHMCFEIAVGKKGSNAWHIYSEDEAENQKWNDAFVLCHMFKSNDDPRLEGLLRAATFIPPGARMVEGPLVPLALNDQPLTAHTIKVVEWMLANPASEAISQLQCLRSSLAPQVANQWLKASLAHPRQTLVRINFSKNKFSGGVFDAWAFCPSLEELILEDCGLDDATFVKMAASLGGKPVTCPLERIELRGNLISDAGVAALVSILSKSMASTLEYIGLDQNEVADKGAAALADVLSIPNVVSCLGLSKNKIGNKGALALSDALASSRSLLSLDLSDNPMMTNPGIGALSNLCQRNQSLEVARFPAPQQAQAPVQYKPAPPGAPPKSKASPLQLEAEGLSVMRVLRLLS